MPCGRAGACRLAALLVLLAMTLVLPAAQAHTTDNGPHDSDHTHFYLWRTTITVGESNDYLGYDKSDAYGSISTGADFGYPPWNPPHKHHVDWGSYYTVEAIKSYEDLGANTLEVYIEGVNNIAGGPGNVTLWLNHTAYPFSVGRSTAEFITFSDRFDDVHDVTWNEDDEVRVALVYERALPSEPKNVSVTAPPGEDGTLEVSWDEPDDEGTFPIECYLVEFRHPSGEAKKRKQSYPGSLGPGKGCGDSPPTSVRRTDLEPGTEYRVLVQALSGDGYGDPETRTVATRAPGNPQALPGMAQGPVEPLTEEPVEPLTMRLKGIPNEHDGKNHPFVLRMVFSEPVTATEQEMRGPCN